MRITTDPTALDLGLAPEINYELRRQLWAVLQGNADVPVLYVRFLWWSASVQLHQLFPLFRRILGHR